MPVEKYSTLQPQKSPHRILKGKLLTALGGSGVYAPYPQNPEHILERKILLQNPFNPNAGGGGGGAAGQAAILLAAWKQNVLNNSGTIPTPAVIGVMNTFLIGLITAGLDKKMLWMDVCPPQDIGSSATSTQAMVAALTPLIFTVGNLTGIPGASTSNTSGLSVNGVAGLPGNNWWYTPNLVLYTDTPNNNVGITLYNMSGQGNGLFECGSWDHLAGPPEAQFQLYSNLSGNALFNCWDINGQAGLGTYSAALPTSTFSGMVSGNKLASNNTQIYCANSTNSPASILSSSNVSTNTNNIDHTFFTNFGWYTCDTQPQSTPVNFTNKTFSFKALHTSLTLTDFTNLFNLVQTMRTSFGGGFV